MPITKSKAFVTSDNLVFISREAAALHELEQVFASEPWPQPNLNSAELTSTLIKHAAKVTMTQRDIVLSILSERKPRAPKVKPAAKSKRNAAVNASDIATRTV